MSARALAVSAVASVAAVVAATWVFGLSLGRAAMLAPAIILAAAAIAGLAVLWARAALDSLRRARHPQRLVALFLAALAALSVLTWLGVELPRE